MTFKYESAEDELSDVVGSGINDNARESMTSPEGDNYHRFYTENDFGDLTKKIVAEIIKRGLLKEGR